MSRPIRVLPADDTLIAREGWRKILEADQGAEQAPSSEETRG